MTQGLDLSYCQPNVDFTKIKSSGYSYVILRAGYGNALKYPSQYDTTFESHYKKAKAAGLNVGAYWYSYAMSVDEAKQEAQAFIKSLSGKTFEYPVYFDIEEQSQFYKGRAFCDSIVTAFCEELTKAGYYAGVYCSTYWYSNFVSKSVREKWPCWIAEYSTKCNYSDSYGMWQNGLAYVDGLGWVDHDFCYVDYPKAIKAAGRNGFKKPTVTTAPKPTLKDVTSIAKEVIAGKWSAGAERKAKLVAAGYNYTAVQNKVNELMSGLTKAPDRKAEALNQVAKEVIAGKWGAGAARVQQLTKAGYNYAEVQTKVNELLGIK